MYFGGEGVPADNTTALRYFRAGVKEENFAAYNGLGLMHLKGAGTSHAILIILTTMKKKKKKKKPGGPEVSKTAITNFNKAAEARYPDARGHLALLILNGEGGLKKDYNEALRLLNAASQSGHILGQYYLGVMQYLGLGTK